jgi:hypothetical protein
VSKAKEHLKTAVDELEKYKNDEKHNLEQRIATLELVRY